MSDTFKVRVLKREGAQVQLRAAMTGAQDFDGSPYPGGRSFFLMMAYMEDRTDANAPESDWSPLKRALAEDGRQHGSAQTPFDLLGDADWLKANIDRYVPQVTLTRTRMLNYDLPRE